MEAEMSNSHQIQNVFAFNVKHEVIHVSDAESGRKGYYCMGCKREMQAVKSKIVHRISYFRHDAKDVKGKVKCTYSDETYRHKLAKEILQRLKVVKVPAVYKYPPKGVEGDAYKVRDARSIKAATVRNELRFYEKDNGEISWGRSDENQSKSLLLIPDVTFFDTNDTPILLIELVATHKVTDEKKVKIRRLGIDTIQINIPKSSPEEIEAILKKSVRTKWLYNYEEASTEYLPISERRSEEIFSIDEDQRKLFEENFTCRSAEIGNLIRSIEKCLESEPHRAIERRLERELQRVKENTEKARKRLEGIRNEIRERVEEKLREERVRIEEEEDEFQRYIDSMEERYNKEKRKDQEEEDQIDHQIRAAEEVIQENKQSVEARRREIKWEEARIRDNIERERKRGVILERRGEELEEEDERLCRDEDELEARVREEENAAYREFEEIERRESEARKSLTRRREDLPEEFRRKEERIREGFEELRRAIDQTVAGRMPEDEGLSKKLNTLVGVYEQLHGLPRLYRENERVRKAQKAISDQSYKDWIK